jgi:hypothetical protein
MGSTTKCRAQYGSRSTLACCSTKQLTRLNHAHAHREEMAALQDELAGARRALDTSEQRRQAEEEEEQEEAEPGITRWTQCRHRCPKTEAVGLISGNAA